MGGITTDSTEWVSTNKIFVGEYKYHTSWEWLMPVVEKIESFISEKSGIRIYVIEISGKSCLIYSNQYDNQRIIADTKLQAVYSAVVQFLIYYKTQHP